MTATKLILELFRDVAPIIFVVGRHGRGKTDFALLIAELLFDHSVIKKFSSNIMIFDPKGYDYSHVTNLWRLQQWLYPKRVHKLFILDEAGINIDRRNPLGKVNRQIRYIGFLVRKFRGKLIFISQRSKDIESTFSDTDIWLGTFRKLSKREAILIDNLHADPCYISDIPATSLKFDSYDIAPFSIEPSFDEHEAKTEDQAIYFDWLNHGNYSKTSRKYKKHVQEVKRIVLRQAKLITETRPK